MNQIASLLSSRTPAADPAQRRNFAQTPLRERRSDADVNALAQPDNLLRFSSFNFASRLSTTTLVAAQRVADVVVGAGSRIHSTAAVGVGVTVGAYSSVEKSTVIGDRVEIGDNTEIASSTRIGDDSVIGDNVSIGNGVTIGRNVVILYGAVIADDAVIEDGAIVS